MTNVSPIDAGSFARVEAAPGAGRGAEGRSVSPARRGEDRVEVSDVARLLSRLRELPAVRTELVDRVREEISQGRYETEEKLELAIDGLVEDVRAEGR